MVSVAVKVSLDSILQRNVFHELFADVYDEMSDVRAELNSSRCVIL